MSRTTVRVGIIGLGKIAQRAHLPHFSQASGCRLSMVSSSRPKMARAVQGQYGELGYVSDWRDLVRSDEVDAIAVCTPNDVHAAITVEALRRGKHVLVEKPIATRRADAARMVALARAEQRVLEVHHHLRFEPLAAAVRQAVARGLVGRIVAVEGCFCHRGPKGWAPRASWFYDRERVGGGVLMDLGVHAFDLLRYWLADEVERISVLGLGAAERRGGLGEHHATSVLRFRQGAVGTVTVSWRDSTYRNRWYLLGERGALELDLRGEACLLVHRKGVTRELRPRLRAAGTTAQQAFVDRIRGRLRPQACAAAQGVDGQRALEICLAAGQSLRKQLPVLV